jgi:hypothetical protein
LGFKRGTPEHAKCRFELARKATPQGSATDARVPLLSKQAGKAPAPAGNRSR